MHVFRSLLHHPIIRSLTHSCILSLFANQRLITSAGRSHVSARRITTPPSCFFNRQMQPLTSISHTCSCRRISYLSPLHVGICTRRRDHGLNSTNVILIGSFQACGHAITHAALTSAVLLWPTALCCCVILSWLVMFLTARLVCLCAQIRSLCQTCGAGCSCVCCHLGPAGLAACRLHFGHRSVGCSS